MIENHVRAQRTILSPRRSRVDCADISIDGGPGIHRPKRSTDWRGIAAARSYQKIAVGQSKDKAILRPVAIKIRPEHDISR